MDAFTAKEHTCFYVQVLDQHLPLAVSLLTDILRQPLFAPADIEKEKAVVLQEIKMVEDTPDDLIHDLFAEQVWAGHPLGRPILGRWDVVKEFDRDTVLGYFEREGRVSGDATLSLSFKAGEMNDVLKSLTLLDLSGRGRVSSVAYDSTQPIDRLLAEIRAAKANRDALRNQTLREVGESQAKLQAARKSLQLYREGLLSQAELSFRSALVAYQTGRVEFVALLEAQRALREARMGYYKATASLVQNLADLERAVGKELP